MTARTRRIVTTIVVIATLQAIAIGIYRSVDSGREAHVRPAFAVERIAIDDLALGLERADATRWTLDTVRGHPVVLHFWATWCGPCRSELPTLVARQRWLQSRGIELVLASVDDDWGEVRSFFGEAGVPPAVSRATDNAYKRLTTGMLPETLFIDARGKVHARARGARDWSSSPATAFLETLAP